MNMFRAFMELDSLYESDFLKENSSRQANIEKLRAAGKNYNFAKYTDAQIYNMVRKLPKETQPKNSKTDVDLTIDTKEFDCCDYCGTQLNTLGTCPVCDDGEEDLSEDIKYCWFGYYLDKEGVKKIIYATKDSTSYDADEGAEMLEDRIPEPYTKFVFRGSVDDIDAEKEGWMLVEGIFDDKPSRSGWVTATGAPVNKTQPTTVKAPKPQPVPSTSLKTSNTKNKPIVTIFYDNSAHKLRARADDGIHGIANVAFPNSLRNTEGQQYEVDELIWNGKNYRASGNIIPIN